VHGRGLLSRSRWHDCSARVSSARVTSALLGSPLEAWVPSMCTSSIHVHVTHPCAAHASMCSSCIHVQLMHPCAAHASMCSSCIHVQLMHPCAAHASNVMQVRSCTVHILRVHLCTVHMVQRTSMQRVAERPSHEQRWGGFCVRMTPPPSHPWPRSLSTGGGVCQLSERQREAVNVKP